MIEKLINKFKGWWNRMFDYNKIIQDFNLDTNTSSEMLDAIQKWSQIFNGSEPWIDENTTSLHVAKTMCEKVSKAVNIEYKSVCSEPYVDKIYQKFLKNKRRNTEAMIGKSCIFFRPYYDGKGIKVSVIQADKFIPTKFSDDGDLLGCILIDQITKGRNVYTRLEYNEIVDDTITIKNIAYKGTLDGVVLSSKIDLHSVEKWKNLEEIQCISGVDRLIGGFATTKNVNAVDNSSPIGMPIFANAIGTLKEIDKQFSRTLWEYEGSELAIDADESVLETDKNGNIKYPTGKKRLFRKLLLRQANDKIYNIFSPQIRDTSLFNGLNELLRQAENQCHIAYGTLSKLDEIAKTATEIKTSKQDYYVTIADIQDSLQQAYDDLIYGIYVLCRLYNIPVKNNYVMEHDWDDSTLVDKETTRNQAMLERNNNITSDVQYLIETRNMKEKEAIAFVKKQNEYRKITAVKDETEVDEE